MRARLPVLLALPLLLGPGLLACLNGAYFDGPRLWAAIVAWALLAIAAVTLPRPLPASGPGRAALAGLAALTAWTAISLSWAPDGGAAVDDVQRLLLYLPYLALAIAVLGTLTEPLLLTAIAGACLYGLSERFVPGAVDLQDVVSAGDRLAYPLSYWNGSGAFAAIGLVLATALAGDAGRPARLRAAAAAAAPPLALTVLLTFSRGALGALAAGVLLLLAIAPSRGRLAAALLVVGGGMATAGVLAVAVDGLRTAEGAAGTAGVAALAGLLAAMAACWFGARALAGRRDAPAPPLRAVALAAVTIVLIGTVVAMLSVERAPGQDDPRGAGAQRLASVQSNRYAYWKVAVGTFADHPLQGEGSGSFRAIWLREREFREVDPRRPLAVPGDRGRARPRRVALTRPAGRRMRRRGRARRARAARRGGRAGGVRATRGHRLGLGAAGAHARRAGAGGTAHRGGRAANPGGCRGGGWPSPMSAWFALRRGTASPAGRSVASSERTKKAFTPADSVWTST